MSELVKKNLGTVTAYGYAKSKGYTGTEEEFSTLMASYASVAQDASHSASSAAEAAQLASNEAQTASQAAQTATSKASEASQSASTATTKASEASQSASTASTAASSASTSAQTATTAAATATTKASEASESATTATTAKTDAETARDAAAQSASRAEQSAESIDPATLEHRAYGAYVVESASGTIASFADGADSIPMKDVLVHIEPVQEGSGDPSPDNVRPISGWTAAKVQRCGKNLLPNTAVTSTIQGVTYTVNPDGSINANGTSTGWQGLKISEFTLGAGQYKLMSGVIPSQQYYSYFSLSNGSAEVASTNTGGKKSFTISEDTTLTCRLYSRPSAVLNNVMNYPMILLESDADTTYTPFVGYDTYDITFPTEAGTVYGGLLDVTNGELIVNKVMMTLDGTRALTPNGKTSVSSHFGLNVAGKAVGERNILSNRFYAPLSFTEYAGLVYGRQATSYVEFYLPPDIEQTAAAGKAWFAENPTQLCYYLATPITYHLTPTEIKSLLGENNVLADAGDSEVEYRADTKMYITKKITEAVSALS